MPLRAQRKLGETARHYADSAKIREKEFPVFLSGAKTAPPPLR